jgi:hypothetical protein
MLNGQRFAASGGRAMATEAEVRASFRHQAHWCEIMGSPDTANLCRSLAKEMRRSNPVASAILGWDGDPDPKNDALALRVAGALHHLTMNGRPQLADIYLPHPPTRPEDVWKLVDSAMCDEPTLFSAYLSSPPQTNEVGRCGALLPGLLEIAHRTGLPLSITEIGSSAGLNLIPDLYSYRFGASEFGRRDGAVMIAPDWIGKPPHVEAKLSIVERRGVDRKPIDIHDAKERGRLISYVWRGQPDRMARTKAAIGAAIHAGVHVENGDAADFVEKRIGIEPVQGVARVLYHSVVWQYLPPAAKARIEARLEAAGGKARKDAPVAWLRLEKLETVDGHGLDLTLWPGGRHERLAQVHAHGAWVKWLI